MESAESLTTLADMPLGGRLLVRSRTDWRTAVISRNGADGVTLSVASPKGRNYRLRRAPGLLVYCEKGVHFLRAETGDIWTENFAAYDSRW